MTDLFDLLTPPPALEARARATDPASSHEAAERVTKSGRAAAHAAAVLALVKAHPGLTSRELSALPDCPDTIDRVEMARRTADLERAGKVRKGEQRTCGVGGTKAVTWFVAE